MATSSLAFLPPNDLVLLLLLMLPPPSCPAYQLPHSVLRLLSTLVLCTPHVCGFVITVRAPLGVIYMPVAVPPRHAHHSATCCLLPPALGSMFSRHTAICQPSSGSTTFLSATCGSSTPCAPLGFFTVSCQLLPSLDVHDLVFISTSSASPWCFIFS